MLEAKDLDLNLLVVFQEIYQQGQISAVAKRLQLSQPAVSNALARLRRSLGDELFVRTATGMQPTPRAAQLADAVGLALTGITQAINEPEHFAPQTSQRQFTLAMSDVGEVYFMPILAAALQTVAPHIQIQTVRAVNLDLKREMEAGRVDLALGAFDQVSDAWHQRSLFSQAFVCMLRSAHPLAQQDLDLTNFLAAQHLWVESGEQAYLDMNQRLAKAGVHASYRVPHFVAVPYIVSQSDLIVTVPQKLAERAASAFGLIYKTPPLRLPRLHSYLYWHKRYHEDAGNIWLRQFLCAKFQETPEKTSRKT